MIHITRTITIDESEIQEYFVRTSEPGGQNVNKVATAVQLRFDVANLTPRLLHDLYICNCLNFYFSINRQFRYLYT